MSLMYGLVLYGEHAIGACDRLGGGEPSMRLQGHTSGRTGSSVT